MHQRYQKEIVPHLQSSLGLKNPMQAPRVQRVVLNMGVGEGVKEPKALEASAKILAAVTGQKPVYTKAKRSIASFHIREGMNIGVMVTLRGKRMYYFLDRLFNIVLPRFKDFRGLPISGFDGRGNYNIGVREQLVFPEISYEDVDKPRGMNISIVTTARTDAHGAALLRALGMPLREREG
ncbi:MAG: 50S ribosomal protein L5 [bacterium]